MFTLQDNNVCGSNIPFSFDLTKEASVLIMAVIEVRHNDESRRLQLYIFF